MDPITVAVGVQLAASALKIVQDYSSGAIDQTTAHQRLVDASVELFGAVGMFNRAVAPPPPQPKQE